MKNHRVAIFTVGPVALSLIVWNLLGPDTQQITCRPDYESGQLACRPVCPKGHFSLRGMSTCTKWLNCAGVESEVKIKRALGNGAVKMVYLAEWDGHEVALNVLLAKKYKADFKHGLGMLQTMQPSIHVTQLVGVCRDSYVTEYHKHGTAQGLVQLLETESFSAYNTLDFRFGLCIKYAKVVEFLHNSSSHRGVRVMCDSNDLDKTLSQYLVMFDLDFVVNDLDALPKVVPGGIKCGHRELIGDFVAPEQLWPYNDKPFKDEDMPGYDEKTDIWKIPNVCEHFLGEFPGSDSLKFHLFKIHKQCKLTDASDRPTASQVLMEYQHIFSEFDFS